MGTVYFGIRTRKLASKNIGNRGPSILHDVVMNEDVVCLRLRNDESDLRFIVCDHACVLHR
jgi:hypothetical protein